MSRFFYLFLFQLQKQILNSQKYHISQLNLDQCQNATKGGLCVEIHPIKQKKYLKQVIPFQMFDELYVQKFYNSHSQKQSRTEIIKIIINLLTSALHFAIENHYKSHGGTCTLEVHASQLYKAIEQLKQKTRKQREDHRIRIPGATGLLKIVFKTIFREHFFNDQRFRQVLKCKFNKDDDKKLFYFDELWETVGRQLQKLKQHDFNPKDRLRQRKNKRFHHLKRMDAGRVNANLVEWTLQNLKQNTYTVDKYQEEEQKDAHLETKAQQQEQYINQMRKLNKQRLKLQIEKIKLKQMQKKRQTQVLQSLNSHFHFDYTPEADSQENEIAVKNSSLDYYESDQVLKYNNRVKQTEIQEAQEDQVKMEQKQPKNRKKEQNDFIKELFISSSEGKIKMPLQTTSVVPIKKFISQKNPKHFIYVPEYSTIRVTDKKQSEKRQSPQNKAQHTTKSNSNSKNNNAQQLILTQSQRSLNLNLKQGQNIFHSDYKSKKQDDSMQLPLFCQWLNKKKSSYMENNPILFKQNSAELDIDFLLNKRTSSVSASQKIRGIFKYQQQSQSQYKYKTQQRVLLSNPNNQEQQDLLNYEEKVQYFERTSSFYQNLKMLTKQYSMEDPESIDHVKRNCLESKKLFDDFI